jgi:hypothetical protein
MSISHRIFALGLLLAAACAGKSDELRVDLGSPIPDPFTAHPIALEVQDQRKLDKAPKNAIGKRNDEHLALEGEDVVALVRRATASAFRKSGLSVPDQPPKDGLPVIVTIDRLWVEYKAKAGTPRVEFDGALTVKALGQEKAVSEKFETGAYGATKKKRPFGKALTKGIRRLQKQLELLGASLPRTSTVSR